MYKVQYCVLRVLLLFICLSGLFTRGFAERVSELPQVMKPFFIEVGDGRLYVGEKNSTVHFYELKKGKPVFRKTFGKKGEGPGEFQFVHRLSIKKDFLEIPTVGKYARFTFEGKFIDEVKLPFRVMKNNIFKVGENYLSRSSIFKEKEIDSVISLRGPDFKLIKNLGQETRRFELNRMNFFTAFYGCRVVGNHFYIVYSDKKTVVKRYDRQGNRIGSFTLPLPPLKVNQRIKEKIKGELSGGNRGAALKAFQKRLYFPEEIPGLNYFNISRGTIITRTFQFKEGGAEFVFFDLNGKELKRVFLHDTGRTSSGIRFSFYDNVFYYIKENEETEMWELYAEKIL